MNCYRIFFNGHYPVGAVAIVTATSPRDAAELLMEELTRAGLAKRNNLDELESGAALLNVSERGAEILLDGNY